jgi:DNA helicase IV
VEDKDQIVKKLVEVLPEELDAIEGGLLAVIADGELLPEANAALRAVYGHRVGTGAGSYAQDIVAISPREAKGLEFDGVVVLEPTAMLNHEHGRVGDLYVAMTRPTQRLRLIAASGVPTGIEE